ncbi:hypothetical protein [Vineibacter terrae]|uniref:hypothetical protein n=1 Tax=Vineibacter terrae TaxID=2586908 RepID=UPI0015B4C7A9|nr:hypothetical protein [Vineibacter terrae]
MAPDIDWRPPDCQPNEHELRPNGGVIRPLCRPPAWQLKRRRNVEPLRACIDFRHVG